MGSDFNLNRWMGSSWYSSVESNDNTLLAQTVASFLEG